MSVPLTPEREQFIEEQVTAGRFADAGAVVTAALQALAARENQDREHGAASGRL